MRPTSRYRWLAFAFLLLLIPCERLSACLNDEDEDGHRPKVADATFAAQMDADEYVRSLTPGSPTLETEETLASLKEEAASGSSSDRRKYAIALVRLGRAAEALPIFELLADDEPDSYTAAANLGTAYELTGNDKSALQWIRKGIELNPS